MRDRILNGIGLTLLVVCFAISLVRVMTRSNGDADSDQVTLRFAHWQLEGGVRDAFAELAREYEALHPGVKVEQMAIPEKIAKNWARTQLIGGTAPDIVQIGGIMGTNLPEVLSRYFVPLTEWVNEPNPYNAGTELEEVPWRDTFIDGLNALNSYSESLLENYGIPNSIFTVRIYYNVDLWREVTGSDEVPESFEEWIAVCEQVRQFSAENQVPLIPIAGSKYNAPMILENLFQSQTQKIRTQTSRQDKMESIGPESALAYLDGRWSWNDQALRNGLELMQKAGQFMQAGFLSIGREDALLYFIQGRALMIATGSWDRSSLLQQVPFEIGAFKIPVPGPDHPVYGAFTEGQMSEAGIETGLTFGITNESRHREVALDFLRFLSSQKSNATFSEISGWLPAVLGVEVGETMKPFEPIKEGAIAGFQSSLSFGSDTRRLVDTNFHLLVGANPSIDRFLEATIPGYSDALVSDLDRLQDQTARGNTEKDAVIAGYWHLTQSNGSEDAELKLSELLEAQARKESEFFNINYQLDRLGLEPAY